MTAPETRSLTQSDRKWMEHAMSLAHLAEMEGEVPVGAVIVRDGEVIGRGHNQPVTARDPTAHAEIVVIRKAASKLGGWRLTGCTLYVTLEPCPMCSGATVLARVDRIVFGLELPAAMFQSVNAFFIITLAPVFSIVWLYLNRRGWEQSAESSLANPPVRAVWR